ncbi:hypothetical protein DI09_100p50 [Mitosporidium daphniae]|uniref:Uncharacterized protein n=1 Tax=Mitosporidium daphniae TaxID=1485682 RepID=A0A098VZQ8_9MICR|nr:uncharacterized protein DI09_100p50 [Mitosporidium daphniae]KGG53241.1 hypothetical protein DI09_100p50 [Mitosporidium daphniae]|eukprot:XP_013239677.1 uncharacterized protein DI09_100p50 [Mitosporidium daphniae]
MIQYISELEASVASSSEVNWKDALAKYSIYSLELSQLEDLVSQKNLRSFLSSTLAVPRIDFKDQKDEALPRNWFGKIFANISSSEYPVEIASETKSLCSMEDFFALDQPRISSLISEYAEKIKNHDSHFINLINQIEQEQMGLAKPQRAAQGASPQSGPVANLAGLIKYQYEL